MKLKQISAEQLGLQTGKFLDQAQQSPLIVRPDKGAVLVIRPIHEDDLADELMTMNPRFRAAIRRARRNRKAGKGLRFKKVQSML